MTNGNNSETKYYIFIAGAIALMIFVTVFVTQTPKKSEQRLQAYPSKVTAAAPLASPTFIHTPALTPIPSPILTHTPSPTPTLTSSPASSPTHTPIEDE